MRHGHPHHPNNNTPATWQIVRGAVRTAEVGGMSLTQLMAELLRATGYTCPAHAHAHCTFLRAVTRGRTPRLCCSFDTGWVEG